MKNDKRVKKSHDKKEWKIAYRKAYDLNESLSIEMLSDMHRVSENAINKYLYAEDRYPRYEHLLEVYNLILVTDFILPIELRRIMSRAFTWAHDFAKKKKIYVKYQKKGAVGEKLQPKRYEYFFNGDKKTLKEISNDIGREVCVVRARIKEAGIENSGDVSLVDFSVRRKKRKNNGD